MTDDASSRYCAFCGLPLPKTLAFGTQHSTSEIDYCCSGCRTVASVESAEGERGARATSLLRLGMAIFFAMNVMVFTMALWSQDIYPAQDFSGDFSVVLRSVFRWASMLFSLPVLWLLGGPIASGVWQAIARRAITADLLILLGVGAAYAYSTVSVVRGQGHVYFEVAVMVLIFVTLGRWLEAKGKRQTNESLDSLTTLLPATVRRQETDGAFRETAREAITTGDILRVLPGERLPVDGEIVRGQASIDQQIVTGESQPHDKHTGDAVYSGTLNLDGDLLIRVTAADGRETISRLIDMVRTARQTKGPQEQLADRIAVWFVPLVCVIALAAAYYQSQSQGIEHGILAGLAVTLIACPCALGLATPMAVWTALGRAAQAGVLFRSGQVMQQLATVRAACFDKTGTLTDGQPAVGQVVATDPQQLDQLVSITATVAAGSTHPLATSIVRYASQRAQTNHYQPPPLVQTIPGKGLACEHTELGKVLIGSRRLMEEFDFSFSSQLRNTCDQNASTQRVLVGWQGEVRGAFFFDEAPRPETAAALNDCRDLGLELHMLTGDQSDRAEAVGRTFSLASQSNQLPEDKVERISTLAKQQGVAMVGDGLNDAPALAAATVGVALGCGADVSRDAAGVCLLADDLRHFPWAIRLARQTDRIVRQNLAWAFAYNGLGIALAASGRLNPIWAALAMALSSFLVVTNSLRLKQFPLTTNNIAEFTASTENRSMPVAPPSQQTSPLATTAS